MHAAEWVLRERVRVTHVGLRHFLGYEWAGKLPGHLATRMKSRIPQLTGLHRINIVQAAHIGASSNN